ncbi:hypothetical protein MB02_14110 [Croceicoccus estronivorus]|uniref:TetR/AcrR family transcriptional regulator n=1 Tax=Croceicoccus estronivorus TaxID=1172626 RepID=UPI000830B5B9|nr:TetR/AcrR family transcriptional regulator [Croceicoccus estronivorus]OCC22900.1 hypothetical protein MB02_14110 [Croceicoccus estronivorus]
MSKSGRKSRPSETTAIARPTREVILSTAENVFAAKGFEGASLDDIAREVGIRRPSVLHHFPTKRAIYDEVEKLLFTALIEKMESISVEGHHFDRLFALLLAWFDFMIARPTAARIIMRNTSDLVARAHEPLEFSRPVIETFEDVVNAGVAAGEFRQVSLPVLLSLVGSPIIFFVCNERQIGRAHEYKADSPDIREEFTMHLRNALAQIIRA